MTEETCANCGHKFHNHWECIKGYGIKKEGCQKCSCKKFKAQNHTRQDSTLVRDKEKLQAGETLPAEKSLSEMVFQDRLGISVICADNVKEAVKRLKNGIEQMKRNVVKDNCKDEEVDFWMNKMETPVIKLIDKIMGDNLI